MVTPKTRLPASGKLEDNLTVVTRQNHLQQIPGRCSKRSGKSGLPNYSIPLTHRIGIPKQFEHAFPPVIPRKKVAVPHTSKISSRGEKLMMSLIHGPALMNAHVSRPSIPPLKLPPATPIHPPCAKRLCGRNAKFAY